MTSGLDTGSTRPEKASKILSILDDFFEQDFTGYRVIDIGCSDGSISRELAPYFSWMVGSDVDAVAIQKAGKNDQANLSFIVGDGSKLAFPDQYFDIAICAQVYEHTDNQTGLISEIWRILRPGGVCFFSGPNRLAVMEEHYWLPFLSWLPHSWANLYMRLMKKGTEYDIKPMFLGQVRRLVQGFELYDYTEEILKDPQKYSMQTRIGKFSKLAQRMPSMVWPLIKFVIPNYNWILVKPK